jgi:tRNA-specific 2-thiouridylase
VLCNPEIKFKYLIKAADELGAFYIATGHYANTLFDETEGRYFINKAASEKKDQSYMLYRLGRDTLERLLLPLGGFCGKDEVRDFVRGKGIDNHNVKDSQEICFLPEGENHADYIKSRGYTAEKGEFVDINGKTIGEHQGVINYTIGQRKNLGMAFGKPMFVIKLDYVNNTVTLGSSGDLFSKEVISRHNIFTKSGSCEMPAEYDGMNVRAKVRYAADTAEATITCMEKDVIRAVFTDAQRAVTQGQSVVFYDGSRVIGGGIIDSSLCR